MPPSRVGYLGHMHSDSDTPAGLRVALSTDSELVTHGLAAMLSPYADRIHLVTPGSPADVTLIDPTVVDLEEALTRHERGRLAFYVWDVSAALVTLAKEHGIGGCLTKHLAADRLVLAIERIHAGHVVVELSPRQEPVTSSPLAQSPLTPREASVIRLITNGLSNEDIAFYLNLSINSVKSYIRSTYRKIDAGSRAQAVVWGVRNGYLSEPEETGLSTAS